MLRLSADFSSPVLLRVLCNTGANNGLIAF
jgi:hypothetical protein